VTNWSIRERKPFVVTAVHAKSGIVNAEKPFVSSGEALFFYVYIRRVMVCRKKVNNEAEFVSRTGAGDFLE